MICLIVNSLISGVDSASVSIGIGQSIGLGKFMQFFMRQMIELENQMTCMERVQEYIDIKPESNTGEKPEKWPTMGNINYRDVKLRYPKTNQLTLKGVSFDVEGKQKIGIIGRTGAGKTSIISALFRLYEVEDGDIEIDNKKIRTIELKTLRSNMSIIPQSPVLFSNTIRANLDPKMEYSDSDLWRALEEVGLKDMIANTDGQLDSKVQEGRLNFSAGQKQLMCLARAIIKKNKIIILDEATANIDPHTDVLLQETISRVFKDCTILTIAHTLKSVLNSDKVMVVSGGEIIEFDAPETLLKDTNSNFYYLVTQSGLRNKDV